MPPVPSPLELAAVVAAATVSGAVNVVAGGGSFLTLSLLLLIGVPAPVANATNRVGVLTQSLAGLWGFHRHGVIDWAWALKVSVPVMAGAGLGAWLALAIPPQAFSRLLATLMLVMTGWSLWRQRASSGPASTVGSPWGPVATNLGFFLMGIYGGFIQAGIGFLLLAFTSAAGFDLVKGNAIGGQKSVHECWFTQWELQEAMADFKNLIAPAEDRVIFLRLDPRATVHTLGVGVAPEDGEFFYQG